MTDRMQVLLASRSQKMLDAMAAAIDGRDYSYERRWMVNGDLDPLQGRETMPDILVLSVAERAIEELSALANRTGPRPPLIVVGDTSPTAMRLAMQAGARDFLGEPLSAEELRAALERVAPERIDGEKARTTAFLGAKGGVGTTMLAVNVAHNLQVESRFETTIVDLDLRFGSLYHYMDLHPKRGLMDAIDQVDELDRTALGAFLTRHHSGLQVMSSSSVRPAQHTNVAVDKFIVLLELLQQSCDRLVLDVPYHLEGIAAFAVERADDVVIVMQQSLSCIRNTVNLIETLERMHAVPKERILLVLNRYSKNAAVGIADIDRALGKYELLRVPNQFQTVAESIEVGVPLYEHAPNSAVSKAVMALEAHLGGRRQQRPNGILSKAFSNFLRS
jgi:pilus assembly protein CpaE